eukprot:g4186.t1
MKIAVSGQQSTDTAWQQTFVPVAASCPSRFLCTLSDPMPINGQFTRASGAEQPGEPPPQPPARARALAEAMLAAARAAQARGAALPALQAAARAHCWAGALWRAASLGSIYMPHVRKMYGHMGYEGCPQAPTLLAGVAPGAGGGALAPAPPWERGMEGLRSGGAYTLRAPYAPGACHAFAGDRWHSPGLGGGERVLFTAALLPARRSAVGAVLEFLQGNAGANLVGGKGPHVLPDVHAQQSLPHTLH